VTRNTVKGEKMLNEAKKLTILWVTLVMFSSGMPSTVRAQMILPLPSDVESPPAFRLSGGLASAGTIDDFLKLNISDNSSVNALFEFSPFGTPKDYWLLRNLTVYTLLNKGPDGTDSNVEEFDAVELLFPLSKDVAALIGLHRSFDLVERDTLCEGISRHGLGLFGDYSLQQRRFPRDSSFVPDGNTNSSARPVNVSTWHIGVKYAWTTTNQTERMDEKAAEKEATSDTTGSTFGNLPRKNGDSYAGSDKVKIVRLTVGAYFVNIQIAKNTISSLENVLQVSGMKDSYRGVGMKFAFQYGALAYEFDYKFIKWRRPSIEGLYGSTFSTKISVYGKIKDAF
jgi:hypothetical protein